MAMTPEQKRAYNKEYYEKYRKKGQLKGRKKGTSKAKSKTTSTSLLGTNTSGLNDEGRIQAALIRDKLKKEMNEALKNAKSDEEKEKIRIEYSRKAMQQIAALRSDSQYAKAKATSTSSGSSKSSGSSGRSSSSGNSTSKGSQKAQVVVNGYTAKQVKAAQEKAKKQVIEALHSELEDLKTRISNMSDQEKKAMTKVLDAMISTLKKLKGSK